MSGTYQVEHRDPRQIQTYEANPLRHPDSQIVELMKSIETYGFRVPLILDEDGVLVAGKGRLMAALKLGLESVPCHVATGLSPEKVREYRLVDNYLARRSEWDPDLLGLELEALGDLGVEIEALDLEELTRQAPSVRRHRRKSAAGGSPEEIEDPGAEAVERGQVLELGRHRLSCGDATSSADVAQLLGGVEPDLILTDPPYCSGGYQEADRQQGTWRGTKMTGPVDIINDRLSTRGYTALLSTALCVVEVPHLYLFSDWRMWSTAFDLVEAAAYSVRGMIVWNKKAAGMGVVWRAQHELILWGTRGRPRLDRKYAGAGNVLEASRTGNNWHPTEKPVDLLEQLLSNSPFCGNLTVYDPFLGSGSTLLAAERLGWTCYGLELTPDFCEVTRRRYQIETGQLKIDLEEEAEDESKNLETSE